MARTAGLRSRNEVTQPGLTHAAAGSGTPRCGPIWTATAVRDDRSNPETLFGGCPTGVEWTVCGNGAGPPECGDLPVDLWIFRLGRNISPPT